MTATACERCGFDPADYSARDLATAAGWLAAMTEETVGSVPDAVRALPPVETLLTSLRTVVTDLDGEGGTSVRGPERVGTIHGALHGLHDLGRLLHDAGAGAPTQQGMVVQLNTSDGGVPKAAVPSADVGPRGLLGDRQESRIHHGRPFQALCLWSAEVIDALGAEGHPIRPGAAGENVTIGGIDWTTMRPGVRLLVGEVVCELSAWATPCRKNDQWFTGRSDRIDHDRHPGWSRVYAWVREPGTIATGDVVVVEP